eukprot:jgi/Botrbrau1/11560/Bobra.60_1s0013.1
MNLECILNVMIGNISEYWWWCRAAFAQKHRNPRKIGILLHVYTSLATPGLFLLNLDFHNYKLLVRAYCGP